MRLRGAVRAETCGLWRVNASSAWSILVRSNFRSHFGETLTPCRGFFFFVSSRDLGTFAHSGSFNSRLARFLHVGL